MSYVNHLAFLAVALIVLDWLRVKVPIDWGAFFADVKRFSPLALLAMLHYVAGLTAVRYLAHVQGLTWLFGITVLALSLLPLLLSVGYLLRVRRGEGIKSAVRGHGIALLLLAVFYLAVFLSYSSVYLFEAGMEITIVPIEMGALMRQALQQALVSLVLVGVSEELLFRVAMFALLRQKFRVSGGSAVLAVSALVFGLAHIFPAFRSTGVYRIGPWSTP